MIASTKCDSITTVYEENKPIILRLCRQWCNRSGIDWDTALSAANLGFMEAYEKYDPERGTCFSTFLWRKVWFALKDTVRVGQTRFGVNVNDIGKVPCEILPEGANDGIASMPQKPIGWFERLYTEASDDCRCLLNCLKENPSEIRGVFNHGKIQKVKRILMKKTGFSVGRFKESFQELRGLVIN